MKSFHRWAGLAGLCLLPAAFSQAQAPDLAVYLVDGNVRLHWTNAPLGYRLESVAGLNPTKDWVPVAMTPVLTSDNRNTVTLPPSGLERFFRLGLAPLTTIAESSPVNGELGVGVMRETILHFTAPLAANTLFTPDNFFAGFQGRRLLSRLELASDRRTVTLFYLEPLPAGAQVTAVFDGTGLTDELGRSLDPDGDGQPGGMATVTFQTFGSAVLPGTGIIGHVFASELMAGPGNTTTTNRPLAGVTITVDGQEQTLRTVTDAKGYFSLNPSPAGRFFVKIDGRTAAGSQYPSGAYYPFVGKPWEAIEGKTNNLAGGTGEIFLPKIVAGTLKQVSPLTNTIITFPPSVLASNPALAGVSVTILANSLYNNDGTRGGRVGIAPVSPDRLPAPLPAGVNPPLVITIQTDGANNLDRPAPMRFPNLPDRVTGQPLPLGGRSALWGFNHKTGRWEIQGTMSVSADGKFIETDPGGGVHQPGWDFAYPGSSGSGGGAGDGGNDDGGNGGGSGDPGDPCALPRKSAESNAIQCGVGIGFGILTTVAKATPGLGCAISAAQGVIGSVADCNIDPTTCGATIFNNVANTALGCLPVLGAGLGTASTLAGIYKSCLIDANKAAGEYALCKLQHPGSSGGPPRHGHPLPAGPDIAKNVYAEQLALLQAAADLETVVFGSVKWTEVEVEETPKLQNFLAAVQSARQPGTPGDARLTPEEQTALLQLPLPSNLTAADAAALLDRFDRVAAGTLSAAELDLPMVQAAAQQLLSTGQTLQDRGWVTTYDASFRGITELFAQEGEAQAKHSKTQKPLAYRLVNLSAGGVIEYGHLNLLGAFDNLPLEANAYYQLDYFDRTTFFVGHTFFQSADNGLFTAIPLAAMGPANPKDSDHDGLPDEAELVLNTDPSQADTDGDGVSDGAEVAAGTDPLDGLVGLPRVIGLVSAPGTLQVAVRGNYALLAEGAAGLGIYNVTDAQPSLVAQLDLGRVTAVAFAGEFGLATVGRNGLAVLDLSNPVQPVEIRFIGIGATDDFLKVVAAGDLAYVISRDAIYLVDWVAGALLDQRSLSFLTQNDTPQDIAVSGNSVYLLTGHTSSPSGYNFLHRFNLGRALGADTASLLLEGTNYRADTGTEMALAPGYVYLTGLNASLLYLSSSLATISDGPTGFQLAAPLAPITVYHVAATGSGAVLAGGASLLALDVHDPQHKVAVQATFTLPDRIKSIALEQGRAYVSYSSSDASGGLAVVNYFAPDTLGQPPTIALSASFPLAPALVEPNTPVVVTALAVDDVQVRNVEFYRDGVLAANVGAYPFDFRFTTPATTNQTSFKLRARAFDTGGNVATTDEVTVLVKAGATPLVVTQTVPLQHAVALPGLTGVQASFSQPLNTASVSPTSLQLVSGGADGLLDTADDRLVDGQSSYDPATQTLQFTPTVALSVGNYRATVATNVMALPGTHLPAPFSWTFSLKTAVTWNVNAAGAWLTANNWTNQSLPQAGDFVLLDRTNGTYTVSYNGGNLSLDSLFSREPLAIIGGKFSLARRSRIENNLTLTGATLSVGHELDVTGGLVWQGSVLDGGGTTRVHGELSITGSNPALIQHTLVNLGHATWQQPNSSGILVYDPAATIRNAEGAVWDAFDRQIMVNNVAETGARFDNDGLFRVFGNAGGINFNHVGFNNHGTVSVATGSLKLNGGGLATGAYEIAAPGTLEFGADHVVGPSASIRGAGGVSFLKGRISLNGSYDVAGVTQVGAQSVTTFNGPIQNLGSSLLLAPGARATFLTSVLNVTNDLVVDGGTLEFDQLNGGVAPRSLVLTNLAILLGSGEVEVRGPLLAQSSAIGGPGRLIAHGHSILSGLQFYTTSDGKPRPRPFDNDGSVVLAGNIIIAAPVRNLPGGTFDLQGDYSVQDEGSTGLSAFINSGTLRKSAGAGNSYFPVPVRNSGLVEALTGKLSLNGFTQTAGEVRLAGGGLVGGGKFDLQGGRLTGTGTIGIYQFNNLGAVVSPGLPDAPVAPLHLTGSYSQGASATLAIDLAGTTPGTGFDQLTADIQANLAGTLAVTVAPAYQPAIGDSFRILSTAQLTGKFTTVTTTGLAGGLKLAIQYTATGVTITVVNGP